jgi:hypothetical protein
MRDLVGGALDAAREPPLGGELVPIEDTDRNTGVADVRGEEETTAATPACWAPRTAN